MSELTITGKLVKIFQTEIIGENFKKRSFVIETEGNYPQKVKFDLIKDKCDVIDKFKVNQEVEVKFNVNGREWTNPQGEVKYFTSLNAWRIKEANSEPQQDSNGFEPPEMPDFDADTGEIPF